MTDATIVVPWRPDGAHRDRAWAWCRARWVAHHPDWPLIEVAGQDGPWRKARLVNQGVDQAATPVVVVADADIAIDPDTIRAAADRAAAGRWVVPHEHVERFDDVSTRHILDTPPTSTPTGTLARTPYPGRPGGGLIVLPTRLARDVPMDDRFAGWGHEDDAWGWALTTLAGPHVRVGGPLWHLWHPRSPDIGDPTLLDDYRIARGDPKAMRAVLDRRTPDPSGYLPAGRGYRCERCTFATRHEPRMIRHVGQTHREAR